ncbi:MAG: Zn-ribbon domain-containing OB-fold protein [Novosphingobium sp.]
MIHEHTHPVAMSDAIGFHEDGSPFLTGLACSKCGEVTPGHHMACPACFEATGLQPVDLGRHGTIFAWTIVYRSHPGVSVPLISAAIKLDSGAHVLGNIEGLAADPEAVAACLGVTVDFATLKAPDGTDLIRYLFKPQPGDFQ